MEILPQKIKVNIPVWIDFMVNATSRKDAIGAAKLGLDSFIQELCKLQEGKTNINFKAFLDTLIVITESESAWETIDKNGHNVK